MMRAAVLAGSLLWPTTASAHVEPDAVGPHAVQVDGYDFGDEVFQPVALTSEVEVRARVYSPAALDEGPFPIVFVLHGRHGTCYDPDNPQGTPGDGSFGGAFIEWPCSPGRVSIPSHEGYDYLGELLASHGFIVVSLSANGVAGHDDESDDFGAAARADLINEHLVRWGEWNARGAQPFGDKFVGAVDFEHIGLVGHSRGGEGAAASAAFDQADGDPDFIDAVLVLAPTDTQRFVVSDVALAAVLPYCDGDVFDLQGVHYFDDARHALAGDRAPKYVFTFDGANHNFYNTVWTPSEFVAGTFDDFAFVEESYGPDAHCGSTSTARLDAQEQRASFAAYAAAFFRLHLRGETEFEPVVRGDVVPASAVVARPEVSYSGPEGTAFRLDVNRLDAEEALEVNALGESVQVQGAAEYSLCGLAEDFDDVATYVHCVADPEIFMFTLFDGRQPHTPGLGQLRIALEDGGSWTNRLPPGTDVSALAYVQLRIAVDFESPLAAGGGDVALELTDGEGASATVSLGDFIVAPRGTVRPVLPRKLLRGVRVALGEFEGVDLRDLAAITLRAEGGSVALVLSDLAFTDAVPDDGGTTGTTGDSTGAESGDVDTTGASTTSTTGLPPSGDDTGTDTDANAPVAGGDDGCGCRSAPGRGSWAALLLIAVAGIRRRRFTLPERGTAR